MLSEQSCPTCQTPNFLNADCFDCVRFFSQQQAQPGSWQLDQFSYPPELENYLEFNPLLNLQDESNYSSQTQALPSFDTLMSRISNPIVNQSQNFLEDEELSIKDEKIEWTMAGFKPVYHSRIKDWERWGFDPSTAAGWSELGLAGEVAFACYLIKKGYQSWNSNIKEIIAKESWQDLHSNSTYLLRKAWENQNLTKKEAQGWIKAGAEISDYSFVAWLRDIKKETPQWITNYQDDYQRLNERFKKYGLCKECQQPHTGEKWCKDCNEKNSAIRIDQLKKSNNSQIDQFIQKYQLEATDSNKFIEWIPYEQFTNIQYLAQGGFGEVYQAQWNEGNVRHWDIKNSQWAREKDHYYSERDKTEWDFKQNSEKYKKYKSYRTIVLKSLTNSKDSTDFLQETEKFKIIDDWFNNLVPCYGLSQEPQTGNYLMVMQYLPERDLRNYLRKNQQELKEKIIQKRETKKGQKTAESRNNSQDQKILEDKQQEFITKIDREIYDLNEKINLKKKFNQLTHIAQGLKDIHQKKLVHRDFHSGNILKGIEQTACLITDLGLCKPANEITKEEKIFGVLPYVAPEVLQGQPYTQAADIYSFGIVTYEIFSGLPPYYDRAHEVQLGVEICQGLRPNFQIQIPPLLEDLINRCWDNDPDQRPTASELEKILRIWQEEINDERKHYSLYFMNNEKKDSGFKSQLQSAEEYNQNLPLEVRFPDYQIHYGACYHSKLLPTKEITRTLQSSNLLTGYILVEQSANQIIFPTQQITQLLDKIKVDPALIDDELKELAREFVRANQKRLLNKNDQEAKVAIKRLKKELKEKGFTQDKTEEIVRLCEELIDMEEKTEAVVEQLDILALNK